MVALQQWSFLTGMQWSFLTGNRDMPSGYMPPPLETHHDPGQGSWKVEEIQESLAELCPGNWAECQDWGSSSGYLAQLTVIGEVFSTFTDWAAEGDNVPVLGDVPF